MLGFTSRKLITKRLECIQVELIYVSRIDSLKLEFVAFGFYN